jgi:hypothetical protein
MRFLPIVTALVIGSAVSAAAQPTEPDSPIVHVGLFAYRADGSHSSSAYDTEPSLDGTVYVSPACTMGAGNRDAPAAATDAWRFSGKVLSISAEEAVLQLEWQRVLAAGSPATAPGRSEQLTLRAGDRVLLDSLLPSSNVPCWTSVGFEARYMLNPAGVFGVTMKNGVATSTRAGGRGITSGGGTSRGPGSPVARVDGAGGSSRTIGTVVYSAARTFDVNLWLVRSAPGKADEVLHQTLRTGAGDAAFAFSPLQIETSRGPVVLQVTGSVAVTNASGAEKLVVNTNRRATFPNTAAVPRDGGGDVQGHSKTTIPLPGPDEVLSFELPSLPGGNGRPAVSDRLAIRLKIAPR